MSRRYILPAVRQPRPDDVLGPHREKIMSLRDQGFTFKAIAGLYGVSTPAVFYRVHRWSGRLKADKRINQAKDERSGTAWSDFFEDSR